MKCRLLCTQSGVSWHLSKSLQISASSSLTDYQEVFRRSSWDGLVRGVSLTGFPAFQALDDSSSPAAGLHSQQGESRAKECRDPPAEEVVLLTDSDDNDSWDTSEEGPPMPLEHRQAHDKVRRNAEPDQALAPDQAAEPDQASMPDQAAQACIIPEDQSEAALDLDGQLTEDAVAAQTTAVDDRPEVRNVPLLALYKAVQVAMKHKTWSHARSSPFLLGAVLEALLLQGNM